LLSVEIVEAFYEQILRSEWIRGTANYIEENVSHKFCLSLLLAAINLINSS